MSNEKQNQPTNKSSDPTIKVVQKQDKDVQRMKANALRGDSDGRFSNQSVADDVANKSWKVEGTSAVNHQELNIATDDTNINTPLSEPTPQAGSGIVAAPNSSETPQSVTGQVIPTHQNEDGVTTYAVAENHASNYAGLSMTPTGAFTYVPTAIGQSGQSQTIHLISIHNDQSTTHQMLFINNGGKVQVFMDVDNAVIIEDQNVQGNFIHSIGHQDESITDSKVSGAVVEVMQGKYGTLTVTETGDWDYALDNTQLVVQQLKPGEDLYESFTAQVFNHGLHQINIDIKGAEDKAVISGVNTQTITEDTQVTNGQLETSGKLDIVDVDHDDAFFQPQSVMGLYGEFTIDQDGHWTYQANNTQDKIQSLAVGEQLQDVITVTSKDAGTTHDVTVTITGTNDAPVLVVTPNAADFSQGQLTQTDVDTSDTHTFTLVDGAGQYGVLVLDPMTQSYSYSQYPAVDVSNMTYDPVAKTYSAKEVFEFHVDDNHGGQDIQFITLDITAVATAPSQPGGPAQITTSIQTPPMITDNMPVMPLTTQTHQANVVTIDLDAASDSGVSNTDDLTNDFMPTITGHTDMPFSQVEIFEGSQSLGTTTSDGNGRYSLVIAPLTGDADGILHSLFAQATAPSAQSSVISANLDITVDTQTASAVADLNATSDTYSSVNTLGADNDDLTSETLPSFVFSNIDSDADTVEVFDGSTSLGQATLNSNTGNWEFIVTNALSNGDHDISATVTDKAGNLSSAQPLLITIDSQIEAPQVALTTDTGFNDPATQTDNKTAVQGFDVTNIEPNAVVEYSLDNGTTWSTQAPSNQADGTYTLEVRQTDVAGNVSRPTKLDYVIDSQTASPVVDLDAGSDSHSTNNSQGTNVDDITSETTPSFTLTGIDADASQVEVFDGSNSLGFATQGTGVGSWVFTTTSPLADGQHGISAVVTDDAGNVSTQNPALHIGIDTQIEAPQVVLTTDTAFSNAPGSDTDNKTSVQGFDVTNIEPNAVVEYSLDNGATWSTQAPSNQADGTYTLSVRQTDVAGNVSRPTKLDYVIDSQTASPLVDLDVGSDSHSTNNPQGSNVDDITSETTPSFTLTGIDADASQVEVFDGSNSLGFATQGTGVGSWVFTTTSPLADGQHDISAVVTDNAGNVSTQNPALHIGIDTQIEAPQVVLTTDTAFNNAPGSDTDNKTSIQGFDVTNIESNAVVEYSLDNGATWSTQAPSNQADGAYTLSVRQTDVAGNVSKTATLDYVIDSQTASPVVDLDAGSDSHSTNNPQGTNVDDITSETTPSFTLTGIDVDASQVEVFDGPNSLGFATQNTAAGTWVFTATSALADGQHDISAVVTDDVGNVSTQNPALHIGIDTQIEAPQVALTTDTGFNDPATQTDNKTAVQGFDVTNIEPNAVVEYSLDNGATWSTQAPSNQADGTYTLEVRQTDVAGNVSKTATLDYVIDSQTAAPMVDLQAGSDSHAPSNPQGTDGDDITSNTIPSFTLTGIDADASQVEVFDGPNSLGFATQGTVVGSWVFTATSALSDGIHNISAVATDNAGNVSTQNPVLSINVDTQIETPVITLATDTASADNVTYIQGFNLSNIDPSAVVEYSLDGGTNWTTQEPNNQVDGDYSLLVRQTDVAGNSAISAPLPYTVDTSLNAPSVDLTDTSDSSDTRNAQGSNQDDITNQVRPTFELLNIDNDADKVEVFIDGNSIGEAQQDPSTHQWTIQLTSDLVQGSHEVTAIATDIAGNVAQSPQPQLSILVDTQAQSLTISLKTDSGSSSTDHITNTQGFDVQGVEPGAVVEYRLHTTSGTGSWITTPPSNQTDGTYDLEVRQIDIAGNESQPSNLLNYTVDNQAVISINTIAQDDVINAQEHNQDLTISGTTVGVEDGQTVTVELNQQTYTAQVQGNSWALDVPATQVQALTDDSQPQVTVSVTDVAGNTATGDHQITIDTTATIAIDKVSTDDVINAQEHGQALTISGTTTDVEDGQTVSVELNNQTYTAQVVGNTWSIQVPDTDVQALADDTQPQISARVTDVAGNTATDDHQITIDTTATIAIDKVSTDDVINAQEHGQALTISGTTTDVEDGQTVTVELNQQTYTTQVQGNSWTLDVPAAQVQVLTDGSQPQVTVSVIDVAGNTATDDHQITIDTTATITIDKVSQDDVINAQEHGQDLTIAGTTVGVEDGQTVTVELDGRSYDAQVSGGKWTASVPANYVAQLTDGSTPQIQAKVTDIAGNEANVDHGIHIDTTAQITIAPISSDDVINAQEHGQALTIFGTTTDVEDGQAVTVELNQQTYTTQVQGNSWTLDVPAAQVQALTDGSQPQMTASVTDMAGNKATGDHQITIDTMATISVDTVSKDDVINAQEHNQNLTISGTTVGVEDGQTVTVELNQQTYIAQVQGNSWTLDVPAAQVQALTDGSQPQVTVSVTDMAGNTATDAHQITIDTTATISIDTVSTDDVINAQEHGQALTISGDTTDVEDGQTVTVVLNGQSYTADVQQGQWTLDVPATDVQQLSDGVTGIITASVADKANNTAWATHDVHVDTTAQIQIDTDLAGDDVLNSVETGQGFEIKGTVVGVEDNQDVTIDFNGQHYTTQVTSGTWSFTVPATDLSNLKDGDVPHIQVSTTDLAGNLAIDDRDITVDTQTAAPVVDLDSASDSSDTQHQNHGTDHDDLTKDDTPTLILKGIDSDAAQVEVFDGTTSLGLATQGTNGEWTITVANADALSDEVHSITATVTDNAGNTNTSVPLDITVDTVIQVQLGAISNKHQGTGITENANSRPVISGTAEVGTKVDIFDNGNQLATVDTDSSGHFTYTPVSDLSEGLHEFTATATDVAGNQQTSTPQSTTIDTQIAVDVDITDASGDEFINAAETSANSSVISGHIDADAHLTSLIISDGTDQVAIDVSQVGITPSGAFSVNGVDLSSLADGRLTVTAKSMDDAGNTATHSDLIDKDTVNNAQDDSSSVKEESTLKASGNVLNNDNEPDAQTIDNVNHKATVDSQSVAFDSTSTGSRQHGTLTVNADGDYEYVLDNSNTEVQALGEGVTITDTFTYTVLDPAGNPKDTSMTVTITGTNDIPAIGGVISNDVTELVPNTAKALTTNGQLNIDDTDTNVNQSTYPNGEQHFQTAVTPNANAWGSLTIDADGHWQYSVDNSKAELQALQDGDVHIDTFTVTSIDGSETQDITITINGTADAPVITSSAQTGSVIEDGRDAQGNNVDTGSNSVSGKLDVTDVDQFAQGTTNLETAEWTITEANGQSSTGKDVDGVYGRLHIDDNGKWTYDLDNTRADVLGANDNPKEVFTVTVTDSTGLTDTQTITIDVQGTNDMPVISGTTIGQVVEDGDNYNSAPVHSISGDLSAQDPDQNDTLTWTLDGATAANSQTVSGGYGELTINDQGHWEYVIDESKANEIPLGAEETETFTVLATDSSGQATEQTVTITVQGSNENPVLGAYSIQPFNEGKNSNQAWQKITVTSISDADTGSAHGTADVMHYQIDGTVHSDYESGADYDASGYTKWLKIDADSGEVQINTNYGVFNHIPAGQVLTLTVPVTVTDGQGGSDSQTLTIEITGTNDKPTLQHVFYGTQKSSFANNTSSHVIDEDSQVSGHFDFKDNDDFSDSYTDKAASHNIQGNVHAASGGDTYKYSAVATDHNDNPIDGFTIDAQTGEYTFNAGDDAYQHLQIGDTETVNVEVTIKDNHGGTNTKTLTFTVKGQVDAPEVVHTPELTVDEDYSITFSNKDLLGKDANGVLNFSNISDIDDGDNSKLAISHLQLSSASQSSGTLIDLGGGQYKFTPNKDWNGDVDIEFDVDDGRTSTHVNGQIHVNPVNDAPVVQNVHLSSIVEDSQGITFTQADLLNNAHDIDAGDSLSIVTGSVTIDHGQGTLTDNPNGTWTFVPAPDWNSYNGGGDVKFSFEVRDADGLTDSAKAILAVSSTPDDATIIPDTTVTADVSTGELDSSQPQPQVDLTASGKLDIIEPDIDEAHFIVESSRQTPHGFFEMQNDGNWTFTLDPKNPDVMALGVKDTLQEKITVDSPDGTAHYDIVIDIHGTNDAPSLVSVSAPIWAEEANVSDINQQNPKFVEGDIAVMDPDTQDSHTFTLLTTVAGLDIDKTGHYQFDRTDSAYNYLKEGEVKDISFDVKVSDGQGGTDTQTYTLRVTGTNDAPEVSGEPKLKTDTVTAITRQISFTEQELLSTATDPDNDQLHIASVTVDPQFGTISQDGTGGYTFHAKGNTNPQDVQINYEVTDGHTDASGALVTTAGQMTVHVDANVTQAGTGGTTGTGNQNPTSGTTPPIKTVYVSINEDDTTVSGQLGTQTTANNYMQGNYGYLSIDTKGNYVYTLNPHDSATDPINQLHDNEVMWVAETFTILGPNGSNTVEVRIKGNNDAPYIVSETSSTIEGHSPVIQGTTLNVVGHQHVAELGHSYIQGQVTADDVDMYPSGHDLLTYSVDPSPSTPVPNGFTIIPSTGAYVYQPDPSDFPHLAIGQSQDVHVTVLVTDYTGATTTLPLTFTVHGENTPPTADASVDLANSNEDTTLSLHGTSTNGVVSAATFDLVALAKANDVDGDILHVTNVQLINGEGTFTDMGGGVYQFEPKADWHGDVEFTYDITDGLASVPVTATLVVDPVNDLPTITSVQVATVDENAPKHPNSVIFSDADLIGQGTPGDHGHANDADFVTDGDTLQIENMSVDSKFGSLQVTSQGHYTFTPADHFNGDATLTFELVDSQGGRTPSTATIHVDPVNDIPVITDVTHEEAQEDVALLATGKLGITDADSGENSFQGNSHIGGTYGYLSIDQQGNWEYHLNKNHAVQFLAANEHRDETFTVHTKDGTTYDLTVVVNGDQDKASISVTSDTGDIQLTSDPQITNLLVNTPNQVTAADVTATGKLTVHDVDTSEEHFAAATQVGTYGSLTITDVGDWTYTADNNQMALQQLSVGETVTETFTVSSADGSAKHDITVTLTGENNVPVITAVQTQTIAEDASQISGQLSAKDIDNDADISAITYAVDGQAPVGFTLNPGGSYQFVATDSSYQSLADGEPLNVTIDVVATDNQSGTSQPHTLTFTVTGTNDAPVISPITAQTANEGDAQLVTGTVTSSDVDNGATATYSTTATVAGFVLNANGSYRFDPSDAAYQHLAVGVSQDITIPVTVTDEHGTTDSTDLVITITGTNDAPVLTVPTPIQVDEDGSVVSSQLQATDIDGDALTYALAPNQGAVDGFSIKSDGSYSFDASHATYQSLAAGETQDITIELQVSDGKGGTDTQVLNITVTGTNDAPTVTSEVNLGYVEEDNSLTFTLQDLLTNADDVDHHATLDVENHSLTATNGTVTYDATTKEYTYTPTYNYHGDDHLAFNIIDGQGDLVSTSAKVTINSVNDTPVFTQQVYSESGTENNGIIKGQLSATDIETLDDQLQYSFDSQNNKPGWLTIHSDGSYEIDTSKPFFNKLTEGEHWQDDYNVVVTDKDGGTSNARLHIEMTGTNDGPTVTQAEVISATDEDRSTTFTLQDLLVQANDADRGEKAQLSITNHAVTADHGSVQWNGSEFEYTPEHDYSGDVTFSYQVVDPHGEVVDQTATMHIDAVNDDPVVSGDVALTHSTGKGMSTSFTLSEFLDGASDVDSTALNVNPHTLQVDHGTLTYDASQQSFHYDADANYVGDVIFSYDVIDGDGGSVTQHATMSVYDAPDDPVISQPMPLPTPTPMIVPTPPLQSGNLPPAPPVQNDAGDDGDISSVSIAANASPVDHYLALLGLDASDKADIKPAHDDLGSLDHIAVFHSPLADDANAHLMAQQGDAFASPLDDADDKHDKHSTLHDPKHPDGHVEDINHHDDLLTDSNHYDSLNDHHQH
ncbi:VCBS domain-containing protein [Vibrio rumoiensis]|uniref:VCBS domain-containing protein n=1 Tax=Vibrio rumoiensis TaxID=76258 RepID=A0ABW7IY88_9VIBR